MIYLTADLHLGHANIMGNCGRPWQDVRQMDAALIAAINARVNLFDTLYILGDFTMRATREDVRAYKRRIICKHVHLILGNHDKRFCESEEVPPFETVRDYAELKVDGRRICLSHYPFLSWRGSNRGSIMCHGHIHADAAYNERMRQEGVLRYDVGVDANGYAPVSVEELLAFLEVRDQGKDTV